MEEQNSENEQKNQNPEWKVEQPPEAASLRPFDYTLLQKGLFSRFHLVDALLKDRKSVFLGLHLGKGIEQYLVSMFIVTVFFGAIYGGITGMYAPDKIQILYAAVKLPLLLLFSLALCFPTFYIFNSMIGSRLSFGQTAPILMTLSLISSVILVGFAPIAWFFTVSLSGYHFLVIMHVFTFALASIIGSRFLNQALAHDESEQPSQLLISVWFFVYVFVLCQMFVYLGPFVSNGPFFEGKRIFFLNEFFNCMSNKI